MASALASVAALSGARVNPRAGARSVARRAAVARAAPMVRAAAAEAVETASIGDTFAALKKDGQCAFVPFICAGDPNLDATEKALKILDDAGADVIELGVPYSDPLADGPTIQVRRTTHLPPRSRRRSPRALSTFPPSTRSSAARRESPRFSERTTRAPPSREPSLTRLPLPLPLSSDRSSSQAAATRALEAGTTLQKVIDLTRKVSPTIKAPVVLFTYYNPIYQRGFENFVEEIASAGAKGLLVPDIPLEETAKLSEICTANGLDLVLLSTPTTPLERMERIAEASNGFIYLVSVTGVTGVRTGVESRVEELVAKLKKVTDKPVCVGFGISKEEQAQQVVRWGADGVIVGSALVKALGEAASPEEGLERLAALAAELRSGSNRSGAGSGGGFFSKLFGGK